MDSELPSRKPKVSLSCWISEEGTWSIWGSCKAQPLFVHGKHGVCIIKLFQVFFFLSFGGYLSCSQRHTEIISGQAARSSQRDPCLRRNLWSPITSQHSLLWNSLHLCLSVWLPSFFSFGEGGTWPMKGLSGRREISGLYSDNHHKCAQIVLSPLKRNSPLWQDRQSVHKFSTCFANAQTINQINKQTNTHADRNKRMPGKKKHHFFGATKYKPNKFTN